MGSVVHKNVSVTNMRVFLDLLLHWWEKESIIAQLKNSLTY